HPGAARARAGQARIAEARLERATGPGCPGRSRRAAGRGGRRRWVVRGCDVLALATGARCDPGSHQKRQRAPSRSNDDSQAPLVSARQVPNRIGAALTKIPTQEGRVGGWMLLLARRTVLPSGQRVDQETCRALWEGPRNSSGIGASSRKASLARFALTNAKP